MRAHSQSQTEMMRRVRAAQRDTLSPQVQREFGLDRPSVAPGMRRNSSAPSLSRDEDGLPKVIVGVCGALPRAPRAIGGSNGWPADWPGAICFLARALRVTSIAHPSTAVLRAVGLR